VSSRSNNPVKDESKREQSKLFPLTHNFYRIIHSLRDRGTLLFAEWNAVVALVRTPYGYE
jgi:hypothetical protein